MRFTLPRVILLAVGCCALCASSARAGTDFDLEQAGASAPAPTQPIDWELPDEPANRWTVRAGTSILQRGHLQSQSLITSLSGGELLNANQFNFLFQGGPDVYLARRGEWADVDFRYVGVNQWMSTTRNVSDATGVQFEFFDPARTQVDEPTFVQAQYFTSLQSVELNLRRNVTPRISLLAGARYFSLRDRMDFDISALYGPQQIDASVGSANNLLGLQLGADAIVWQSPGGLRLESAIKAGVLGNAAGNSMQLQIADGGGALYANRDHTAFWGDLNVTGVYQFNRHLAFRAGYQFLWLSGVAVASDQMHLIDPSDNPSIVGVDVNGTAFFHGVLLGLEAGW
jgi:hypothetical protein